MGKLSLQRASCSTKPLLMPDSIVGEKYIDFHEIAGFVVKLLCDCTRQDEKHFLQITIEILVAKGLTCRTCPGKTKKVPP